MTLIISLLYLPILAISFIVPAMITLFKKNIHPFFFFTTTTATGDYNLHELHHHQPISSSPSLGLGLISATRDPDRLPNVVESAMLKPSSSPNNKTSNDIGFVDEIGGEVDGLLSCTESLGFESSDERRVNVNNHSIHQDQICSTNQSHENDDESKRKVMNGDWRSRSRRGGEWTKVRSFPPPLKSLNRNGEPSFFLRPVRKDGRLELTEVRIHRPQILHASRHDGRLTLHLVPDHHSFDLEEEEEEGEEEEEVEQEEEEEEDVHEEVIVEEEQEEEGRIGEWRFGKEGLRRCHEMVNQHHHGSHIHHYHHHMRMCGISIV